MSYDYLTVGILNMSGKYKFPITDGEPNTVLTTNGKGVVSWKLPTTTVISKDQTLALLPPIPSPSYIKNMEYNVKTSEKLILELQKKLDIVNEKLSKLELELQLIKKDVYEDEIIMVEKNDEL